MRPASLILEEVSVSEAIQKGRPVGRPPNVANSRLLILAKTAYSHVLDIYESML